MGVIVELSLPSEAFQLGRILSAGSDATISLETMVPLGGRSIPFFRIREPAGGTFEERVRAHSAVDDIHAVNTHDGETLYALDWEIGDDAFLQGVVAMDGHILEGEGSADAWGFQLRFPSHTALSEFQEYCFESDIPLDVKRIYNPTRPEAGPWYGLTTTQREALVLAVETGYYAIPRQISTRALGDELDISDQAVTERLRRAIDTLVRNTLLLTEGEDT